MQTVAFGAVTTAVGLAEDLQKGLIERFRALPDGPLGGAGRAHDGGPRAQRLHRLLITAVGFAVGFRISTNFGLFLCGVLIVLLFSYTLCWGFASVGLSAPNAETAQTMVFPILFPFIFASSAFVPVTRHAGLAAGLRRAPTGDPGGRRRTLAHGRAARCRTPSAVWAALAWCFGLLVVLVPLAVRKYRRVA